MWHIKYMNKVLLLALAPVAGFVTWTALPSQNSYNVPAVPSSVIQPRSTPIPPTVIDMPSAEAKQSALVAAPRPTPRPTPIATPVPVTFYHYQAPINNYHPTPLPTPNPTPVCVPVSSSSSGFGICQP